MDSMPLIQSVSVDRRSNEAPIESTTPCPDAQMLRANDGYEPLTPKGIILSPIQ